MSARLMIADGLYPLVQTDEGRLVILGRGGEWDDIEDRGVLAQARLEEVDFDVFRDAVEALGGVLPEFV